LWRKGRLRKAIPIDMVKLIPILLTVVLLNAQGAIPALLCSSAREETFASKRCTMSQATMPSPMSCCGPVNRIQRITSVKKSPGCCHISLPLPNQSRPALPGSSSDAFRSHIQLQASELELVSVPPQRFLCTSSLLAIAFRGDRSDTYLQSSSLRI
jgi:hypothetical protein